MTVLATLILTGLDLATELQRRHAGQSSKPSHRVQRAEATLADVRQVLASAIRENRDVTAEEARFWQDRINQDRATLRSIASKNDEP